MKECIFDVELVNGPALRKGKRKNNADGGGFDDRAEGFIEIDARLLGETPNYPTSFVTSESAIRVMFVTKNPFSRNYVGTGRRRN
jgi:hypothetical protein